MRSRRPAGTVAGWYRTVAVAAVLATLGTVTACAGRGAPAGEDDGEGVFGSATPGSAATTEPTTAPTTEPPAAPVLRCEHLSSAAVGAVAFPLADYSGTGLVQLVAGSYMDSEGTLIELLPICDTGDLNGDGAVDAVAAVRIDPEGSGVFYTLVVWLGTDDGTPALAGSEALGDRNPVQSISIADGIVTVVYFTRSPDVPLAGLNIRRTATYEFTEPGLGRISYTDVSCAPCNP